ncbi:MAG TPA: hypothetical protein VFJ82_17565 [Longimicrobium sp.]|nr:hypothetical protein [Longimicrobium sp.]
MQKPIEAALDPAILQFTADAADRIVQSRYFVPLLLGTAQQPALTRYQQYMLRSYRDALGRDTLAGILEQAGLGEAAKAALAAADAAPAPARMARTLARREKQVARATLGSTGVVSTPADQMTDLLQSDIGILFLDRTRIRPAGFVLGEHLTSLSLAPGEELVVEQRTFSKREVTYEEQNETEQQMDLELASTLSTSVEDGLDRQQNHTSQESFAISGSVSGTYEGVTVGVTPSYSSTVTDADANTRRRSVKDTSTASRKVSAKYRAQHKTTFRVATEQRFESTSRRTLRNPNRYTPIDLRYFKVMQRLDFARERTGARLAWSPFISDPAAGFFGRLQAGYNAILQAAEPELPPQPTPPVPPAEEPAQLFQSDPKEADQWGWPQHDMSANYDLRLTIPPGFTWDGDAQYVKDSVARLAQVSPDIIDHYHGDYRGIYPVGEVGNTGDALVLRVHVGCDSMWFDDHEIILKMEGRFIPQGSSADEAYQQAYQAWLEAMDAWREKVYDLRKAARAQALRAAEDWREAQLQSVSVLSELLDRAVATLIPEAQRSAAWMIESWRTLFEWESASFVLYPGWWSTRPMRDYTKDAADFVNASWARLYLPIRPGFEQQALRFIVGNTQQTLDEQSEAAIQALVTQVNDYRVANFGDAQETVVTPPSGGGCPQHTEKVLCLGTWSDTIPTDGTHLEVVQASTHAADGMSRDQLDDGHAMRQAETADVNSTRLLKDAATANVKTGKLSVNVFTGPVPPVVPAEVTQP